MRTGDIVERDGKPWRVTDFRREHGQARASGFVVLEFTDVSTQAKTSQKFRLEEQLEVANMDSKQMQVGRAIGMRMRT